MTRLEAAYQTSQQHHIDAGYFRLQDSSAAIQGTSRTFCFHFHCIYLVLPRHEPVVLPAAPPFPPSATMTSREDSAALVQAFCTMSGASAEQVRLSPTKSAHKRD